MSHIAEALAKARQRNGPQGALAVPGRPADDPAFLLARARRRQRLWISLLSVVAAITAFLIWQRLSPDASAPQSAAPGLAADHSNPPAAATGAPGAAPATSADPDPGRTVRALVITAVIPGERPRLMYAGRIVSIGESVAPGLIFSGVRDRNLLFTDAQGVVHERLY